MTELWELYDADRNKLGLVVRRGEQLPSRSYHVVVQCWVLTLNGRVILDKRAPSRPNGGMYECTGGSAIAGETSIQAALRELNEELGITAGSEELVLMDSVRCDADRCFVDTYILLKSVSLEEIRCQKGEVIGACIVTLDEYDALCAQGAVVPVCRNLRGLLEKKTVLAAWYQIATHDEKFVLPPTEEKPKKTRKVRSKAFAGANPAASPSSENAEN